VKYRILTVRELPGFSNLRVLAVGKPQPLTMASKQAEQLRKAETRPDVYYLIRAKSEGLWD
jgi:hypothetical protein